MPCDGFNQCSPAKHQDVYLATNLSQFEKNDAFRFHFLTFRPRKPICSSEVGARSCYRRQMQYHVIAAIVMMVTKLPSPRSLPVANNITIPGRSKVGRFHRRRRRQGRRLAGAPRPPARVYSGQVTYGNADEQATTSSARVRGMAAPRRAATANARPARL